MLVEQIEEIFVEIEIVSVKGVIAPDENLLEQYLIDSFKFIELIVKLEEMFKIEFEEEDILVEHFESLNKIAELVSKYQTMP